MTAEQTDTLENILSLADRDLAAGRYADAERAYGRALELDAGRYMALHGRGVARAWQCTLLSGDPAALIPDTEEALRLCRRAGGDESALCECAAVDLINLTSGKYNELTRVYASVARGENQKAPSPLFFHTWSPSRPQGLTLPDVYLPLINHLAAIIRVSEYLDDLLRERDGLERRRLHNVENLAIFYDWLLAFEPTGRVDEAYGSEILAKKQALAALRDGLEKACAGQRDGSGPAAEAEDRPTPGVAVRTDRENKLAHFAVRPPRELICPVCGAVQSANRTICAQCSCKFFFDDES